MRKKRRIIPTLMFALEPGMDVQLALEKFREFSAVMEIVHKNVIIAVDDSLSRNKKEAPLFRLNDTDDTITMPKTQWKNALSRAMEYFTSKEEYELCTQCRDLINKM